MRPALPHPAFRAGDEHRGGRVVPGADPLPPALAEYNAGRVNAERWASEGQTAREYWSGITYPTTRKYIQDILHRYRRGI